MILLITQIWKLHFKQKDESDDHINQIIFTQQNIGYLLYFYVKVYAVMWKDVYDKIQNS